MARGQTSSRKAEWAPERMTTLCVWGKGGGQAEEVAFQQTGFPKQTKMKFSLKRPRDSYQSLQLDTCGVIRQISVPMRSDTGSGLFCWPSPWPHACGVVSPNMHCWKREYQWHYNREYSSWSITWATWILTNILLDWTSLEESKDVSQRHLVKAPQRHPGFI